MDITDITDSKSIQYQGALFEWIAPICQNLRAPKVTSSVLLALNGEKNSAQQLHR